jgi:hypothetical protein
LSTVPEVYGIAASSLGDDCLGRALAEHVDQIVGSAGAAAIDVFGIDREDRCRAPQLPAP